MQDLLLHQLDATVGLPALGRVIRRGRLRGVESLRVQAVCRNPYFETSAAFTAAARF